MYLVVVCVLGLFYGCRACGFTEYPEANAVAEVGESVTLRCPTDVSICECSVHWVRLNEADTSETISVCTVVYSENADRYSVSSGPDWSLTITGVQPNDHARRYQCQIYQGGRRFSPPVTLIIPSLINISVQPPRPPITTGDNAIFHCNVQSQHGALPTLNVKWFVNGTDVWRFQDYYLDNDGYTLTFLTISVNHTNVYCKAFIGTKFVKRSENYLILIASATQVPEAEEFLTVNPVEFPHDTVEPSASQVPETKLTETTQHQCSCVYPNRGEEEPTNYVTIAITVCFVFSMFFNVVLICLWVVRGQCKARRNTSRESDADKNAGDERVKEKMETQFHGQAASTVTIETTPSSYQDLIFK